MVAHRNRAGAGAGVGRFSSRRSSICPQLSCGSSSSSSNGGCGDALGFSRVARLRGGVQASTPYVADDGPESSGTSGVDGVRSDGLAAETAAAAEGARKRWLRASEHDG